MILISIGNSRTLLARTDDGGRTFTSARFDSRHSPALILAELPRAWARWWTTEEIFLAGVVPTVQESWRKELRDCHLPAWDPEIFHQLLPNAYQPPESLGFDRRCCLIGAWRQVADGVALVIDAGTAITMDTLAHNRFLGGQILPGLQSQLHCLQQSTALLPPTKLQADPKPLANDTMSGMQAGVWYGTLAAIRQAITGFLQQWPNGRIFLTGGDAALLQPQLSAAQHDPLLLLQGFVHLVQENRNHSKKIR
ncbi:type III pantothenate kinase [Acidithiobacillus sp. AMEEHan]|uniref:type III pantothenate kinase n=1 Tax=Acidithiobacillus sp. AMEEHan TaxID=2994951 RepID=UPI0027E52770|nr:type III pantothenate kinase [Acidithiobacillus sp. AMEEHan]